MSTNSELLIPEDQPIDSAASQGRLPGWVRLGLIGTGAAFALGSAGGVVFADTPDTFKDTRKNDTAKDSPKDSPEDTAATTATTRTETPNTVATLTGTTALTTPTNTTVDTTPTGDEATATQTATTPTETTPTTTAGTGLMIGHVFHAGLNDAQLSALADLLGMAEADVAKMSLGQLLRAGHAAGASTHEIAHLLHMHQTA